MEKQDLEKNFTPLNTDGKFDPKKYFKPLDTNKSLADNFKPLKTQKTENRLSQNFKPLTAEQIETNSLKDYDREFTLKGAAEQFATGALNEALLGFPEFAIKKFVPLGEDIWKNMESPVKAERVIRGIGSFLGFAEGAPALVLKGGAKGIGALLAGPKKINRFISAAAKGAGSFGLLEILKAPEEDYGEKVQKVPMALAMGAVLGAASEKLSTYLRIKALDTSSAIGGADNNMILQDLKKRGILNNNILTSSSKYISRQGEEGNILSKLVQRVQDTYELRRNTEIVNWNKISKNLSRQEKFNFVEVAERKALPLSPKVEEAFNYWKSVRSALSNEAKQIGVQVRTSEGLREFEAVQDYFPHMIIPLDAKPEVLNETLTAAVKRGDFANMQEALSSWKSYKNFVQTGERPNKLVKYLIESGRVKDEESAMSFLKRFSTRVRQHRFSNLEYSREEMLPFYDVNPDRVLPRFFDGTMRRFQEIKAFGPNGEIAKDLLSKMESNGLDYKSAETFINRFLGTNPEQTLTGVSEETLSRIRNFNSATKLGLAVIPNASQSINTAIMTGIGNTLRGITKAFTAEGQEFAQRSANVLSASAHSITSEVTGASGGLAEQVLKRTGFSAVEKFNRVVAANAGREFAKQMAGRLLRDSTDKLARRSLKEIGLSPARILEQGGLTVDDVLMAGLKTSNKTQFRAGVQDLPLFWSSPEGKVLTQFKNFSFNQTKFIKEAILGEAMRGNLQPMIRAISLAPILGEGVQDVRSILSGKKRDKIGLERIAENMSAAGGFGIVADLLRDASYGKLAGSLAGPTFSTIADLAEGIVKTAQGQPNKLVKTVSRQVPVAGPLLSNLLAKKKEPASKFKLRTFKSPTLQSR